MGQCFPKPKSFDPIEENQVSASQLPEESDPVVQCETYFQFPNKYSRYIDPSNYEIFSIGDGSILRAFKLITNTIHEESIHNQENQQLIRESNPTSTNTKRLNTSTQMKSNAYAYNSIQKKSNLNRSHFREYHLPDKDGTCISKHEAILVAGFRNGFIKQWKLHAQDDHEDEDASFQGSHLNQNNNVIDCQWCHENSEWKCNASWTGHEFAILSMEISPYSTGQCMQFVSGGRDQSIKLWDCHNQKLISSTHIARNLINDFCWMNPDVFVQVGEDKRIRLFDTRDQLIPVSQWSNEMIITSCDAQPLNDSLSSSYNFIISQKGSTTGCSLFKCDIRKPGIYLQEYTGHELGIVCARYINQNELCSVSNDRTLRIWDDQAEIANFPLSDAPTAMTIVNNGILVSTMAGELYFSKSSHGDWGMQFIT